MSFERNMGLWAILGLVMWVIMFGAFALAVYYIVTAIIREIKKPSPPQTKERFSKYL